MVSSFYAMAYNMTVKSLNSLYALIRKEGDFVNCGKKIGSLFLVCCGLPFIKLYVNQPFVSDTECFVKNPVQNI